MQLCNFKVYLGICVNNRSSLYQIRTCHLLCTFYKWVLHYHNNTSEYDIHRNFSQNEWFDWIALMIMLCICHICVVNNWLNHCSQEKILPLLGCKFEIYFVMNSNRIPVETHWDVLLRMLSKGLILFRWVLLTSTPNKAFYEDAVCDPEGTSNNEAGTWTNQPFELTKKTSHNTVTLHDLIRCFNHFPLNCLYKNLLRLTEKTSKLCISGPLWGESNNA